MNAANATAGQTVSEQDLFKKLDQFVDSLQVTPDDPRKKGHLIEVLHKAQSLFGYLPENVQIHVAKRLFLHHSDVSGVISFYNFFTTKPKGKNNISICMGTACYVKGADKVLNRFEKELNIAAGEISGDGLFSIDVLRCVGACGLAPVVMVNDRVYGRVTPDQVPGIIADFKPAAADKQTGEVENG